MKKKITAIILLLTMLCCTSCEITVDSPVVKLLYAINEVRRQRESGEHDDRFKQDNPTYTEGIGGTVDPDSAPDYSDFDYRAYAIKMVGSDIQSALTFTDYSSKPDESHPYTREREYNKLTDRQKRIYDEMLTKIQNFEHFSYDSENDGYDVMDDAFFVMGALYEDYPEIELYFCFDEVFDEANINTLAIESYYFMPGDPDMKKAESIDELKHELNKFLAVCDFIVESIPKNVSTYEKYKFIAAYISLHAEYDHTFMRGWHIGNAYGPLYDGFAICEGYSRGFDYICRKANLWCELVDGSSFDGELHMWNKVMLGGEEFHVDITWSDDDENTVDDENWLRYFMISEELILEDHLILEDFN